MSSVADVQALADAVDDLNLESGTLAASSVTVSDTNLNGLITGSGDVQTALDRIDNTGLGAAPRTFTGSFFASYGQSGNQDTWYGNRATVTLVGARGQSNGNYIFELPDIDELTSMFDDQAARGLGEIYTLTVEYQGGSTSSVVRNSMTIRPPSVSALFDRNELPVTIAQGAFVTFRISRVGGSIGSWERVGVGQATDPVATFGEVVLQNAGWNNADGSFLPSGAMVQKGYAFPVVGSTPNDGTLRQGLLDSGVSDRLIYDGDYVVWTADTFTSWTNGDDWFVINRDSLQRMSREQSNFLAQTSEIDNRVDLAPVSMLTNDALVWLSENPLAEAPFLTPSTDPSNPRPGDDYRYIGGRDDRNAQLQFQFGQNRFNSYMTVGITPSFIAAHPESTIDIIFRDTDGTITERLNLANDFTFVDDATFTNSTVRHYQRSTSVNYAFLTTIEIWLTQVQEHFTLNPNTVDVTQNIPAGALTEGQLSADVQEKLNRALPTPGTDFSSIEDRLSPRGTITIQTLDIDARYLDTDGTGAYPSDLTGFTQVSPDLPRYTGNNVALFIATPEPGNFTLMNRTTDTAIALDSSTPNVEVVESFTVDGTTYFVWLVTSLTSGHTYEVDRTTLEQVIKWENDIENLQDDVRRIDAQLDHAVFDLPDDVVHVLENDVSVTQEDNVTIVPSAYNNSLGGTDAQTVFFEQAPNSPSGGLLNSDAINKQTGDRARRKLLYLDAGQTYANQQSFVTAFDGSTGRDLISYADGRFNARVFVDAIPGGTSTVTVYPAPATRVSGAGIWQTIPAITFVNGVPVPEADELFFTRNLPDTATTLTIQYRGHANGNIFGAGTTTLAGVGGSSPAIGNFTVSVGSEVVNAEVRWDPTARTIRVSETARVTTGLPTINDIQVILSYQETRTIPATPSRVQEVFLEHEHEGGQVFAFKPSSTGTLIIVGDQAEIDTNRPYTTIFGATESGHITVASEQAVFYDYEDFDPISTTVTDLENHASLPSNGLFTANHTSATDLVFDVAVQAPSVILVAPNATRWRITVDNSGTLSTTQVT